MAEGYEFTVQAPDVESSNSKVEVYETPQVFDSGLAGTTEESASENKEEMASNFTPSSPSLSHAITPLSCPVTPPTQIASSSKQMLMPEGSPQGHGKKIETENNHLHHLECIWAFKGDKGPWSGT